MTRVVANVILIFAAFLFAATSPLWQVSVSVPKGSISGLASQLTSDDTDSPSAPVPLEWGREVYLNGCSGCHGSGINDLGIGEPHFHPLGDRSPRDIYRLITLGEFKPSTEKTDKADKQTRRPERHPTYSGSLVETELWAVALYVYCASNDRSSGTEESDWKQTWKDAVLSGNTDISPPDRFKRFCAQCHGETGYGNGPLAGDLVPNPCDLRDPAWLAGQSFNRLARTIRDGSPVIGGGSVDGGIWSGMPPFSSLMDNKQTQELVNYILSWGYSFEARGPRLGIKAPGEADLGTLIIPSSNDWWNWDEIRAKLSDAPENPPAWMSVHKSMERDK